MTRMCSRILYIDSRLQNQSRRTHTESHRIIIKLDMFDVNYINQTWAYLLVPGFGMTTPRTTEGQIALIFYGFLGCAGGILFFNLFLERIITFLAYILRAIHEYEFRRKGMTSSGANRDKSSLASDEDYSSLDSWKPSVYWVMLILFLSAVLIACAASAMYSPVEQWTYFESIYFCFVAFATIGFGDYVVSQNESYDYVHLYRLGNFIFLVTGCCCIYSLFNVTSIVIKQALNYVIRKLDCRCCKSKARVPPGRAQPRSRRNAITPKLNHWHKRSNGRTSSTQAPDLVVAADSDSNYDSESQGRRDSNEMISMNDFLNTNHIALAMLQKQLYETAQRGRMQEDSAFQGGVGPLAILNKKLGQDDA